MRGAARGDGPQQDGQHLEPQQGKGQAAHGRRGVHVQQRQIHPEDHQPQQPEHRGQGEMQDRRQEMRLKPQELPRPEVTQQGQGAAHMHHIGHQIALQPA